MKQRIANYSLALLCLLTACSTDGAYDKLLESDGIDMTMQVGRDLTLPLGSSDKIYITELLDTADVAQLHIDEAGTFYLSERGELSETTVHVPEVSVEMNPMIAPKTFNFDVDDDYLPQDLKELLEQYHDQLTPGQDISQYTDKSFKITVKSENIIFDLTQFTMQRENVDKALLSLSRVSFKQLGEVKCELNVKNLPAEILQVKSDAQITTPAYLCIDKETEAGLYVLPQLDLKRETNGNYTWSETLGLTGLDFTRDPMKVLTIENQQISLPCTMQIAGNISIELQVKSSDLMVKEKGGQNYVALKNNQIVVEVLPSMPQHRFDFDQVTGRFNNQISPISKEVGINLSDDMSFLQNSATFALLDPTIAIDLTNNSVVPVFTDFTVKASNGNSVVFADVDCTPADNTTQKQVILDCNSASLTQGNLHTLLSPLPNVVTVEAQPRVDSQHDYTLALGDVYGVSGKFEVRVPLLFSDIKFTYDRRVENLWGASSEITERVKHIDEAELTVTISNEIPLTLELEVVGVNAQGKEDASALTSKVNGIVKAGKLGAAVSTDVVITLTIPDTANLKDLIIRVKGNGGNCELNAKECFEITKASLCLPNGLNVDLN